MGPILNKESPLHFLPEELATRQLMIFDSIRLTLEMVDYTFYQLIGVLEKASKGVAKKDTYCAFNYAWSFVDHCHRFVKLYREIEPEKKDQLQKLSHIANFRNAIQHIDKNLEKSNVKMIDNGRPIFGTLKWVVNNTDIDEIYTSIWISGIFNIKNFKYTHHETFGYKNFINDVKLETSTLKKDTEDELNLSDTYSTIKEVVDILDSHLTRTFLEHKLQAVDWSKRKDVILNLKNP